METFTHNELEVTFNDQGLTVDGVFVGQFRGIKEAREYLESVDMSTDLGIELKKHRPLTENDISIALSESSEMRVTETAIRAMGELIEQKIFYPSDALLHLRETHEPAIIQGKIDYVLRDGSTVMIDLETNAALNSMIDLKECSELLMHMTSNAPTFMKCVSDLLEDTNGN